LVEELISKDPTSEKGKLTAFAIESVSNIFTPPKSIHVDSDEGHGPVNEKAIEKHLKRLVSIFEPLLKILKGNQG
jgi:hypothetical protein